MLYRNCLQPLLQRMDPEAAHERAAALLGWAQGNALGRAMLRLASGPMVRNPVHVFGLTFPNRLGIAAGFDKDARIAPGLALCGFGHVEIGTLTPAAQPGNPRPRIFRLPRDRALINRMGFPNCGADAALPRLRAFYEDPRRDYVMGVSIGKQKTTELADAAGDYLAGMRKLYGCADYFAINISSPNTPGLRELQGGKYLNELLRAVVAESRALTAGGAPRRPLLVKIAPDLSWAELDAMLEAMLESGVDGVIACNTALVRDGIESTPIEEKLLAEAGGLSGRPVAARATEVIAHIHRATGGKLPIIGVGGVENADSARAKLDAGAALLQVYTGFIYQGPRMARRTLAGLI